jgi:hypothetical protein
VTPEFAAANPDDVKWGPDDELVEFLMANAHNDEIDLSDPDCGYDDLFRNNLAVAFKPGDRVLFSLDGVEYAIRSCAADLYEAPIADLEGLLAPTAKDYFPALAK